MIRVVLACALVACGGDDQMMSGVDGGTGDGAMGDAAMAGDGALCMKPALDQPWLAQQLSSVVTGLTAAPRATMTQRQNARTYLQNHLTQLGFSATLHQYSSGANVQATLPATTGATKRIIVGAHFDTVTNSPGANDNATGVAAVLAVARYLQMMNCRRYNVTFVLFDEEEVGLLGARAYANMLTVADVQAVHTVDQIGWDNDNDMRFELEMPTQTLETEYRAAAAIVGVPVVVTTTEGTDHEAFRDRGMPAMGLTEEYVGGDTSPYRHMATDTAATVEQSYLQAGTKLVAQVLMTEL